MSADRLNTYFRVLAVMPHFAAIEVIAAHSDVYWSRCSVTSRTARSRTSKGYLPDLVISPSLYVELVYSSYGRWTDPSWVTEDRLRAWITEVVPENWTVG